MTFKSKISMGVKLYNSLTVSLLGGVILRNQN